MLRTFIAIDVPTPVKSELDRLEKELKRSGADVSWVSPERVHLTLKFLGNVAEESIAEIKQALQQVAASSAPFRLQPASCGAFPSLKRMRVVWAGLRGDDGALRTLQKRVEAALVPLGFQPEERPFRAHLTLGRVKGRRHLNLLQEALLARQDFQAEAFDVTELVLYKSDLRSGGSLYTPLIRAVLAADKTTIQ
ncbi:MAG: RNA 2',3'-cyclic phosphodiesterase [Desulforhabdus sp.]|jgi:2'-5' RNA ligase|nr:RNA 2',3'-cyclic phosphodiesterase [Desulforhabdus sp.]